MVNGFKVEGDGSFWNGRGEYWGHDWLWRDENGRIFLQIENILYITFQEC